MRIFVRRCTPARRPTSGEEGRSHKGIEGAACIQDQSQGPHDHDIPGPSVKYPRPTTVDPEENEEAKRIQGRQQTCSVISSNAFGRLGRRQQQQGVGETSLDERDSSSYVMAGASEQRGMRRRRCSKALCEE